MSALKKTTIKEIKIEKQNFEAAKKRLKDFSEKKDEELALEKVETEGFLWGLFDHNVTGEELNKVIEKIQLYLREINSTNNKTIQEFRHIYKALDALDNDYIKVMLSNLNAIKKTSDDVRRQQEILVGHHQKLEEQQGKLDVHQGEIENIVEKIGATVEVLKKFKENLDALKHLNDVDHLWSQYDVVHTEVQGVSKIVEKLSKKIASDIASSNKKHEQKVEDIQKNIDFLTKENKTLKETTLDLNAKVDETTQLLGDQISNLRDISNFVDSMKDMEYLYAVDEMWRDVNKGKESLSVMGNTVENIEKTILDVQGQVAGLNLYITRLKENSHLEEVDTMWTNLEAIKSEAKSIQDCLKKHKEIIQQGQKVLDSLSQKNSEQANLIEEIKENQIFLEDYSKINRDSINELDILKNKINKIEHLYELDNLWERTNLLTNDLAMKNDTILSMERKAVEVEKSFLEYKNQTDNIMSQFEKKIKTAYFIAGGAVGLIVLALILRMAQVI